jgi:HSP20 family protein
MATDNNLTPREKTDLDKSAEGTHSGPYYEPVVNIFEDEQALTIVAEMPGISEKDVEIDLREGVLTLLGKNQVKESDCEGLYTEFRRGNYLRRFTLTDTIDQENISAIMNHGLLKVVLPKQDRVKPRKIQVRTE